MDNEEEFKIAKLCVDCNELLYWTFLDESEIPYARVKVQEQLDRHRMVHNAIKNDSVLQRKYNQSLKH